MYENCPVCSQKYDLEPGFWYGTGYVSYGLCGIFSYYFCSMVAYNWYFNG